jgi:hypothetical protein
MATPNTQSENRSGLRFNQSEYDTYWRDHFRNQRYYKSGHEWDDYEPAYRYGSDSYNARRGGDWNSVERNLESGWDRVKGRSRLAWADAKEAVRDGWHYIERALPGDADRDGR